MTGTRRTPAAWAFARLASLALLCATGGPASAAAAGNADILARSIALYPTLETYADTGVAVHEAPGIVDQSKFRTFHRRETLDFLFDWQGVSSRSGPSMLDTSRARRVLWMQRGELQSFDQELGLHQTIPRSNASAQIGAVRNFGASTMGTSILIPALIFADAKIPGTVLQITESVDAGFETVDERRCHKVIGTAAEFYPSGAMTNVRQVTVWIDAQTLLIRKVFEDTPKGYPLGSYRRTTVTISPQANVPLDDSRFRFTVPSQQH